MTVLMIFCLLGKRWKGGVALVPIDCHPEERKRRGISINGGGHSPPPTPPKRIFAVLGLIGKGSFPHSQYWEILRFAQDDKKKGGDPSQKAFGTTLRVGSERG